MERSSKSMYEQILDQLQPTQTKLVAVSKTKPVEAIQRLYDRGQRIFGESKAQELTPKYEELPKDIEWHMIGHLQRNKVKYIAPYISLIHSVDSPRLLKEVNKQARKEDRVIDCLLQFHIADEESKYGFSWDTAVELLEGDSYAQMEHIRIVGVMGMATFTENTDQVRRELQELHRIFKKLKADYFAGEERFKEVSMGMSGDYQIALEEGSTMVRIGTLLFGERD
jgi:PLP dependent protein